MNYEVRNLIQKWSGVLNWSICKPHISFLSTNFMSILSIVTLLIVLKILYMGGGKLHYVSHALGAKRQCFHRVIKSIRNGNYFSKLFKSTYLSILADFSCQIWIIPPGGCGSLQIYIFRTSFEHQSCTYLQQQIPWKCAF